MFGFDPMGTDMSRDLERLETDDELRWRLIYVTADRVLVQLSGAQLDEYASRYSLRRRRLTS